MTHLSEREILWRLPLARALQYQSLFLQLRGVKCRRHGDFLQQQFDTILNS